MASPTGQPTLNSRRAIEKPDGTHYRGSAVISDGETNGEHEIEIHTSADKNGTITAWHVIIKGRLAREIRTPFGKPLTVALPEGGRGAGILIDLQLIKGSGKPPPC